MGNPLHKGPCLGNLEGVHFLGLFERQMEGSGNRASLINLIWAYCRHTLEIQVISSSPQGMSQMMCSLGV
jgi:hypothetical protein